MTRDPHHKADDILKLFKSRAAFAGERLAEVGNGTELCFALSGCVLGCGRYEFPGVATLRKVEQAPGEIELARALKRKHLMSAVARHMPRVTHELAVRRDVADGEQKLVSLGWLLISAIRCRTQADLLVPAVSSVSWDAIAAMEDGSCDVSLLEDVPSARQLGEVVQISTGSLDWVRDHIEAWAGLVKNPAFNLAVDSFTTHHQQANLRMSAASLWSGFEALFGVSMELRFRLAAMAAAYLEDRGEERLSLYRRIKSLYDLRSKAVHGADLSDAKLADHIVEVRTLLSRIMCRAVEAGMVPTTDELEKRLFS